MNRRKSVGENRFTSTAAFKIPETPKFELYPGMESQYYVLNPQQWEINGLRCTLENTTWRQLGASDDTDDTEFACLTIEKI